MTTNNEITIPNKPRKVIFSFSAYANEIITCLKSSPNVDITPGLTQTEISTVEKTDGFLFPPDLRCILTEGLPVGPGFPNWRSSSRYQLRLLTSLPVLSIVKEVSRNKFWAPHWGPHPENDDLAADIAREMLGNVPKLVPVFRHCYIATEPSVSGNPVFYVHGAEIRLLTEDVGEFYKTTDLWRKNRVLHRDQPTPTCRKIEFWSEMAENAAGLGRCDGWWSGGGELGECLEEMPWQLREGGWSEEDVREMMSIDNGGDDDVAGQRRSQSLSLSRNRNRKCVKDVEGVMRHLRSLSNKLLRSGWSTDEVFYSLGVDIIKDGDENIDNNNSSNNNNWVDVHCYSGDENSLVLSR